MITLLENMGIVFERRNKMFRKDKFIEILTDQRDYFYEKYNLISTELARAEKENEMLKKILDEYSEKKSDTDLIRYKGKTYKIMKRTLNNVFGEIESLDLSCVELEGEIK